MTSVLYHKGSVVYRIGQSSAPRSGIGNRHIEVNAVCGENVRQVVVDDLIA